MSKELVVLGPRRIGFREYDEREPGPKEIKVKTLYSGISHGTEMNLYRGTAPQFRKSINPSYRLFMEGEPYYKYPMGPIGYEEIAEVIETGSEVKKFKVGDIVASAYGHRETAVINVDRRDNFASLYLNLIPEDMNPEHAIFEALGSVAFDSLLTSRIRLGESAVILGQGVIGLLLVQLCKLAGAEPVITVDLLDQRLEFSKRVGADYVFNPKECNVAVEVRKLLGRGSDIVFETSGSSAALHEAIRCGAPAYSRVVAVAWYQGAAENLRLGEEFHHGLGAYQIISAAPGINTRLPPAYGRQWDIKRVIDTFFSLLKRGKVKVDGLITHRIPFEESEKAFKLIDEKPHEALKVILCF